MTFPSTRTSASESSRTDAPDCRVSALPMPAYFPNVSSAYHFRPLLVLLSPPPFFHSGRFSSVHRSRNRPPRNVNTCLAPADLAGRIKNTISVSPWNAQSARPPNRITVQSRLLNFQCVLTVARRFRPQPSHRKPTSFSKLYEPRRPLISSFHPKILDKASLKNTTGVTRWIHFESRT